MANNKFIIIHKLNSLNDNQFSIYEIKNLLF